MTKNNKVYYLAYFKINVDGDFYFEPYKGLNDNYALFESPEEALEAIKEHLKLAIDTFARPKQWAESVKDSMANLYDELFGDESENFDEETDTLFYVDTDWGNYSVVYFIKRVSFMKKDINELKQELWNTETINLALRKQLEINESKIFDIASMIAKERGQEDNNEKN